MDLLQGSETTAAPALRLKEGLIFYIPSLLFPTVANSFQKSIHLP